MKRLIFWSVLLFFEAADLQSYFLAICQLCFQQTFDSDIVTSKLDGVSNIYGVVNISNHYYYYYCYFYSFKHHLKSQQCRLMCWCF